MFMPILYYCSALSFREKQKSAATEAAAPKNTQLRSVATQIYLTSIQIYSRDYR